jgi:hypothetical protein
MTAQHRVAYVTGALVLAIAAFAACGGGGSSGVNGVPDGSMEQAQSGAIVPLATPSPRHFALTVSAGARACIPNAHGTGTISSVNPQAEHLHIAVTGLPHNTGFDLFIIQVPTPPFGLSWYQGDIDTNSLGNGVGDFIGRFSIETFIVAPGVAPAPTVFTHTPFPDAATNPKTGPVQTYHVGLWFDSPTAAQRAGCANTVTPFNGTHNAGIQALNTATFPLTAGPLRGFP